MDVTSASPSPWFSANIDDHWLRHIIEGGAANVAPPRLKPRYIQNHLEAVTGRPWAAELSGRLLSKALDIRAKAEDAAAESNSQSIRFRHVMYVKVEQVRSDPNLDVYAEPHDEDHAHANLIARSVPMAPELTPGQLPKMAHEFVKNIAALFLVCDETNITPLEKLRT